MEALSTGPPSPSGRWKEGSAGKRSAIEGFFEEFRKRGSRTSIAISLQRRI